jgi:O-antigen/teichoic acid export membrane protein
VSGVLAVSGDARLSAIAQPPVVSTSPNLGPAIGPGRAQTDPGVLGDVSIDMRVRIVSGMRWTFWASALAAPFGYGTTIVLARIGPEAVGTYGLLMVYLGVIGSFLYLGGDAVTIKFLPAIEGPRRRRFVVSYFAVICLFLVPWLITATIEPGLLRYLFGERGSTQFYMGIVWASPLVLLLSTIVGALKGLLDFRTAQMLMRALTVGQFVVYGSLAMWHPTLLREQAAAVIWATYLGLTGISVAIGLWRLASLEGFGGGPGSDRFRLFLPEGFWRYMWASQQVSIVWFFLVQLDSLLILNLGGLAELGGYVTVLTVASLVRMVNAFLLDALLPSLTNLLARRNDEGAATVFAMYWRVGLLITASLSCGLIVFAGPIIAVLGPQYASLRSALVMAVLLAGLATPGAVGGTVLSSIGRQQRSVWVGLGQVACYTVLFLILWPRLRITGAVLAHGLALVGAHAVLLMVAKRSARSVTAGARHYRKLAAVVVTTAAVAHMASVEAVSLALLLWLGSTGLFLVVAGYRPAELAALSRSLLPSR